MSLQERLEEVIMDFTHELNVAYDLARKAAVLILEVYGTKFAVAYKGRNDPVTEADTRANQLIVEGLRQAFPTDVIVAEESPPPFPSLTAMRIWYVDPLDGTKEFINKNGEFSVMIGLAVNGKAHLGVVYRPDQQLGYGGIVGQGAWRDVNGNRSPLMIDQGSRDSDGPVLTVSRSHRHPLLKKVRGKLGVKHELVSGSVGLKIGLIAEGKADLYMEPGPYTSVWDACGPEAILHSAGGQFTNILGQQLVYGVSQLKNTHGLVASNGRYHDRAIEALEPVARELELKPESFVNRDR